MVTPPLSLNKKKATISNMRLISLDKKLKHSLRVSHRSLLTHVFHASVFFVISDFISPFFYPLQNSKTIENAWTHSGGLPKQKFSTFLRY
jgi:uncharacterized protein YqhQ